MLEPLLLLHAGATLYMTGLIWFVQVVHYPLMAGVGPDRFAAYEAAHTRRTTWVVAPVMLLEAVTAGLVVIAAPPSVPAAQAWLGVVLLVGIWSSTAFLQVPQHRRLAVGFDHAAHARLVSGNRIRVGLWSARSLLVLTWLA